jgi:hypothetical protein
MKLILTSVVFGALACAHWVMTLALATLYLPNMSMGHPLTVAALDSKGFFGNADRFGGGSNG